MSVATFVLFLYYVELKTLTIKMNAPLNFHSINNQFILLHAKGYCCLLLRGLFAYIGTIYCCVAHYYAAELVGVDIVFKL